MYRQQAAALLVPLVLCWMFGHSSEALSTFGVSNTKPPSVKPTSPPARPCSRQAECAGISASSCVRTHYDSVTRCLCGDNLPPVNGQCEAQAKSLYHVCANSDECNDGLICGAPNITGTTPLHLRVHSPQDKICLCDQENGFKEKEYACSEYHLWCPQRHGNNSTEPTSQDKICLCDQENGFKEKDYACRDADILTTSAFAVIVVTLIRKILNN